MPSIEADADEVVAMLRKVDKGIAAEVIDTLRELAKAAVALAKSKAQAQGFGAPGRSGRGTGELLRDIGYSVRGATALVREKATRDGFKYPAVFEFGRRAEWMDRPFLVPAVRDLEPEAMARVDAAINRALAQLTL